MFDDSIKPAAVTLTVACQVPEAVVVRKVNEASAAAPVTGAKSTWSLPADFNVLLGKVIDLSKAVEPFEHTLLIS